jgi:hypothetical protein
VAARLDQHPSHAARSLAVAPNAKDSAHASGRAPAPCRFASVQGDAGTGSDSAQFQDGPGDDNFVGLGSDATLSGTGYSTTATSFGHVGATSSKGGTDRISLGALNYVFEQLDNWLPDTVPLP